MKPRFFQLSIAIALASVLALVPAPPAAADSDADADSVKMEGSFVWARDDGERTGPLTAVMTPTGENQWAVAFHFTWEEEPHTYLGSASGSLTNGTLEGDAENDEEDHKLHFRFSGDVEDGTFTGTHRIVQKDGSLKDLGTLTLSATE